jgi:DNA-binding transcriptional MerR regulator
LLWNAWIEVYENDKLIFRTHETGLFDRYLRHLLNQEECRKEVGISISEIKKMLEEIEKEWKAVTSDC